MPIYTKHLLLLVVVVLTMVELVLSLSGSHVGVGVQRTSDHGIMTHLLVKAPED